jgi:hypothetical protein
LNEHLKPIPEVPTDVGLPSVAPESCPMFSEDIMQKLQSFNDKAAMIEDFETWMTFLEIVANKLGLNPATDFGKLASVLNRHRVNEGKPPL